MSHAKSPEKVVQEIRRKTRRQFSVEERIRLVLEGVRGEESSAALPADAEPVGPRHAAVLAAVVRVAA